MTHFKHEAGRQAGKTSRRGPPPIYIYIYKSPSGDDSAESSRAGNHDANLPSFKYNSCIAGSFRRSCYINK